MRIYFSILVTICVTISANPITISIDNPSTHTKVTTENITSPKIDVKILDKPHHLFIGRCNPKDEVFHNENIILTNDGKSHVSAKIRMNIDGPVYISCVNIYDEIPDGKGGYPSFVAGGVGYNFIEFKVLTDYGKGFHFFVKIQGYTKDIDVK
ncbi:uncharacterized protein LOC130892993 isoform X1 [Diorhabda carinulata]|uniref:uncharacterized protein LOC130892993 isoform X1 n=1 Tax=Diorhabda carinulata TaxID=1163345 RepID=UPI0025A149BC|nr:uncharacterized protein LOC130892993 isoform X1 [Diorhabda carinulata]